MMTQERIKLIFSLNVYFINTFVSPDLTLSFFESEELCMMTQERIKLIFSLNVYFINTFVSPDLTLSLYAQVGRDVAQ